jgi:hypothetical protein
MTYAREDDQLCGCGYRHSLHCVESNEGGVYCQIAKLRHEATERITGADFVVDPAAASVGKESLRATDSDLPTAAPSATGDAPTPRQALLDLVEKWRATGSGWMNGDDCADDLEIWLAAEASALTPWASTEAPGTCERGHTERQSKCPACHDMRIKAYEGSRVDRPADPPGVDRSPQGTPKA